MPDGTASGVSGSLYAHNVDTAAACATLELSEAGPPASDADAAAYDENAGVQPAA